MWRERIHSLTAKAEFAAPANAEVITGAEAVLGLQLPADLVAALKESDGVKGSIQTCTLTC